LGAALLALLAGCGSSSSAASSYEATAASAAEGAASQVQTARLVAELAAGDRATTAFLNVLLDDSTKALREDRDRLATQQVPPEAQRLAGQLDELLTAATAALDELDRAVQDGDRPRAGSLVDRLGALGGQLRDFAERHR
jgi:hypothetical protein